MLSSDTTEDNKLSGQFDRISSIKDTDSETVLYVGDSSFDPASKKEIDTTEPVSDVSPRIIIEWDGPDDPEFPQNWSTPYKVFLTSIVSLLTLCVTFASSVPSSATILIAEQFNVSSEVSNLVITLFLCGYMLGPILWAPGSELVGRRPIYTLTMFLFCIFNLGQALAPNIQTLMITRFLSGIFASAPLVITGGLIADIWDPVGRGAAASIFVGCVFVGPTIGPIVGGFVVTSYLGWRWIFWLIMITSGASWVAAVLFLPETFAPVLLQKRARKLRKMDPVANGNIYAEHESESWSFRDLVTRTLFRPFNMLFKEPILICITLYLSLIYGVLYALLEAFPIIFIEKHGFTVKQNGLAFIGVGVGSMIGSVINIAFMRHYPKLLKTWRGFPPPEERLYGAMFSAPLIVVSVFWVGWTGNYPSVPWYVPAIGAIPFGMSISLVFVSCSTYMVDTYLKYSASAFAANTIVRSGVAASFPLFTTQMFTKLGVNWASTLIGCLAILLAPSPFLFYRYGPKIRAYSKFAPCIDLKIAKELKEAKAAEAV